MHRILPQQLLADIWENAATALRREFRRFCINDSGDKGWKRGGLVEGSSVAIAAKLVEQHAERPKVCFLGVVMKGPRRFLWRKVPWGTAEERCARMPARVASDLCEAEVPDAHHTPTGEEDILTFQVAVYDAAGVQVLKAEGDAEKHTPQH
jgi:hypothetical protein